MFFPLWNSAQDYHFLLALLKMDPLEGGPLLIESLQQILLFTGPTKESFSKSWRPI